MAEYVLSLEEPWQRPPGEERRAGVRYPSILTSSCCAVADRTDASWLAHVRDVSTFGVGLVLPTLLQPGTLLEIDLGTPPCGLDRTLLARIVHASEYHGDWVAGCAFTTELGRTEIELFRAERVRSGPRDSRRWVRYPCNVETVCFTCLTAPGEQAPARVIDISPGGIGLLLPCQFESGTLLHFELTEVAGTPTGRRLVRVVRALEHANGDWFLGCEFAEQLSPEELLALR